MGENEQSRPKPPESTEAKTPECLPGEAGMCYSERGVQKSAVGFVENATRMLEGAQKLEVAGKINQIINFIGDKLEVDWSKVDKTTADELSAFAAQGFTEINGFDKDQRWVSLKDKNGSTRTLMIRFPQSKGGKELAERMRMYEALAKAVCSWLGLGFKDWDKATSDTQERLMAAVEKGLVDIDYERKFKTTSSGYEINLTDRRGKTEAFAVNFEQKPKEAEKPAPRIAREDILRIAREKGLQEIIRLSEKAARGSVQQTASQFADKWKGRVGEMTADDRYELFQLGNDIVKWGKLRDAQKEHAISSKDYFINGIGEIAADLGVPQDQLADFAENLWEKGRERRKADKLAEIASQKEMPDHG